MKKAFLLFCSIVTGFISNAQTVPGGDMENWRTGVSGSTHPDAIHAPVFWYGADSLIIADGESFGTLLSIPPTVWKAQLFEEDTIFHGGAHSAKLVTVYQDTLGNFPGILSNSQTHITVSLTGVGPVTYTGGTGVTMRPQTVSAWVQYYAGKDTTGAIGPDTALLTVQAISTVHGVDTLIGTGIAAIPPCSSWTQITANIAYPPGNPFWIDTLRIIFSSTGGGRNIALDSSTLYVDDVTFTDTAQDTISHEAVANIAHFDAIKVYPNPSAGTIYFDNPQNEAYNFQLFTVSGQCVVTKTVNGKDAQDIANLADGLYFYTFTDMNGGIVQRGKLNLLR